MKRPLSAFEQEVAAAMDEYANQAEPPAFNAQGIMGRERRRVRFRVALATLSVTAVVGVAAYAANGLPGTGNSGHSGLPAGGASGSTPATAGATASGSAGGGGNVPSDAPAATAPWTPSPSGLRGTAQPTTPGSQSGAIPSWPTATTSSPFAGTVPPVPELTAIRVGAHPSGGYERISLEFTGQAPGFRAEYVSAVVRQGSGAPVALPGSAFLQLTFSSAQAHDENGNPTLHPSPTNPVAVGFPELRSYVLNGDFEGTVSVALGLTARDGFHVSELAKSPTDHVISVDVALPR